MASFGIILIFSLLVSIPATIRSAIILDQGPPTIQNDATDDKKECRTLDVYTMVFSYFLGSSFLFCFTMSFLFSLCIVGSPYLRDVIDEEEYKQRYVQLPSWWVRYPKEKFPKWIFFSQILL